MISSANLHLKVFFASMTIFHIFRHVVHDMLGMDLFIAQNVNIVVLSVESSMFCPVVFRFVSTNFSDGSRVIFESRKGSFLFNCIDVANSFNLSETK